MPPPPNHRDQAHRFRASGLSAQTMTTTATQLWDQSPEEARRENKLLMNRFALEATSCDILAELMLKFRQQENHIDLMTRHLKDDGLPASFHNTYRLALNDCRATLLALAERRDKEGRDRSKRPENKAQEREEQKRLAEETHRLVEHQRIMGYFYDTRHGIKQPGNNILGLDLAIRDVLRMRMLPKSPREDYLIAQAFDALSEAEKKIDPNTLSDEERETDLHDWYPDQYAAPGQSQFREYDLLTQRVFLERVQEYNKTWEEAEKHIDGLMAAKGIQPRTRYPYLGVPPLVRNAAKGDPAAIEELKAQLHACDTTEINNNDMMPWHPRHGSDPSLEPPHPTQEERDWGKASSIVIALLLAFSSIWTCTHLLLGQHLTQYLAPGSSSRGWSTPMQEVLPTEPETMATMTTPYTEPPTPLAHLSPTCQAISSPRDPAPGLKSRGLNAPFFSTISTTPDPDG